MTSNTREQNCEIMIVPDLKRYGLLCWAAARNRIEMCTKVVYGRSRAVLEGGMVPWYLIVRFNATETACGPIYLGIANGARTHRFFKTLA